jgi:hypothetical protein
MDLIIVYALFRFPDTMALGKIDTLPEDAVVATMPNAIRNCPGDSPEVKSLWKSEVCMLHEPEHCPAVPMFTRGWRAHAALGSEDDAQCAVRKGVQDASRTRTKLSRPGEIRKRESSPWLNQDNQKDEKDG